MDAVRTVDGVDLAAVGEHEAEAVNVVEGPVLALLQLLACAYAGVLLACVLKPHHHVHALTREATSGFATVPVPCNVVDVQKVIEH